MNKIFFGPVPLCNLFVEERRCMQGSLHPKAQEPVAQRPRNSESRLSTAEQALDLWWADEEDTYWSRLLKRNCSWSALLLPSSPLMQSKATPPSNNQILCHFTIHGLIVKPQFLKQKTWAQIIYLVSNIDLSNLVILEMRASITCLGSIGRAKKSKVACMKSDQAWNNVIKVFQYILSVQYFLKETETIRTST